MTRRLRQATQKRTVWQVLCRSYLGPSLAPAVQYYRDGEGHRYRSRTDVLKALGLAESKAAVSKAQAAASAQMAAGDMLRATPLPLANGVLVERCGQAPAAVQWCCCKHPELHACPSACFGGSPWCDQAPHGDAMSVLQCITVKVHIYPPLNGAHGVVEALGTF